MKKMISFIFLTLLLLVVWSACESVDSVREYENDPLVKSYRQIKSENSPDDDDQVRQRSGCPFCQW